MSRAARFRATADPRGKCFTLGTPRGIYAGEPFQIFQRSRDLTVVFQFGHSVRTIHTKGTGHPDGRIDFWLGDSRALGGRHAPDATHFGAETWLERAGNSTARPCTSSSGGRSSTRTRSSIGGNARGSEGVHAPVELANGVGDAEFVCSELGASDCLLVPRHLLPQHSTTFLDTGRSKYEPYRNTFAALHALRAEAPAGD